MVIQIGMLDLFWIIVGITALLLFVLARKHFIRRRWEASSHDIEARFKKVAQGQRGEFFVQQQLAKLSPASFAVINNYPIYERTKKPN
jgi:hypothetical protein